MKRALQNYGQPNPNSRKSSPWGSFWERVTALSPFSRRAEAQKLFNLLLRRREFNGWSFVDATLCISMKPTKEEVRKCFEELEKLVAEFFGKLRSTYHPNLHEISSEESQSYPKVFSAKVMTTIYDDLYFVSAVVILRRNDDGTWQIVNTPNSSFDYFREGRHSTISQEYPVSIRVSFCGGFGDVNYIDQTEFEYSNDRFFAL